MPLPESKEAILALATDGYKSLDALMVTIDDNRLEQPGLSGGWSAKDVLLHLAFWHSHLLRILDDEALPFALPGEDEETALNRINDEAYRQYHDVNASEARRIYADSRDRVLADLRSQPEDMLLRHLDAIRWNTWEHCAEHEAGIRVWLAG